MFTIRVNTCTKGQDGSSMAAPAFAARAPLRKVGPRLTVTLANLTHKMIIYQILLPIMERNGAERIFSFMGI